MTERQEKLIKEKNLKYCEADYWYDPVVGKELVRFDWNNSQYKGHFVTVKGRKYVDDFIMERLKQ